MSDTLKGYSLGGTWDQFVVLNCERCGDELLRSVELRLVDVVDEATEHSGRCLG